MLIQPFRSGFRIMWSLVAPGNCYQSWLDWSRRRWAGLQERLVSYVWITLSLPTQIRTHSSSHVFQLYSLFLTAAAGHVTEGQSNAAAWASAMHAGTQAMMRCSPVSPYLFLRYIYMFTCIVYSLKGCVCVYTWIFGI